MYFNIRRCPIQSVRYCRLPTLKETGKALSSKLLLTENNLRWPFLLHCYVQESEGASPKTRMVRTTGKVKGSVKGKRGSVSFSDLGADSHLLPCPASALPTREGGRKKVCESDSNTRLPWGPVAPTHVALLHPSTGRPVGGSSMRVEALRTSFILLLFCKSPDRGDAFPCINWTHKQINDVELWFPETKVQTKVKPLMLKSTH